MKKSITVIAMLLLASMLNSGFGQTAVKSTERNIELAQSAFAAFNKHDWHLQASYFSDTCRYLDPSYGNEYKMVSRKEKAEKYRKMEEKSPDIKDEIVEIFGINDKVVIQFISSGTFQGETGPVKWSLPICCIFTFKNGLIIKDETYYNRGK